MPLAGNLGQAKGRRMSSRRRDLSVAPVNRETKCPAWYRRHGRERIAMPSPDALVTRTDNLIKAIAATCGPSIVSRDRVNGTRPIELRLDASYHAGTGRDDVDALCSPAASHRSDGRLSML